MEKIITVQAKITYAAIFLILACVLATPNYGVVILALLSVFAIYSLIKSKEPIALKKIDKIIIFSAASYFLAFIPTAILDGSTLRYFDAPLRFLICIPIYLLIRQQLNTQVISLQKSRNALELGAIAGSIGAFILAIYQSQVLNMPRVDGFLFSINFGYLASALAFLCLVFFRDSNYKVLNLIGFVCAIIATILTLTRGAIIAIPILLIISLFYLYKDKLNIVNILIFILTISAISFASYQYNPKIKARMNFTIYEAQSLLKGDTAKASSTGGRIQLWVGAIEAFKENPIIGTSYKNREAINRDLYNQSTHKNTVLLAKRGHAHNQYFEILAAAGLIGMLALFLYLLLPGIYFYTLFKKNNSNVFALNGFIFTLGFWIYCMTEVPLEANSISSFYAFIQAILLASSIYYQKKRTHNA